MCGRYTLAADADELLEAFDVPSLTFDLVPRYNIAPGQRAPIVAEDRRGRRIGPMTWGLIPAWREEPGAGLINARVESVLEKPSFQEACRRRRCLVPADGFYEWTSSGGQKVPHWIHRGDGKLMSLGGIWERWKRDGEEPRHTFAILTTAADPTMAALHDRVPLVVPPADRDEWLDRATATARVRALLRGPEDLGLAYHRVSPRVNRVTEDDARLILAAHTH